MFEKYNFWPLLLFCVGDLGPKLYQPQRLKNRPLTFVMERLVQGL